MALVIILPLLLGVGAYWLPLVGAKIVLVASQVATIGLTIWLLLQAMALGGSRSTGLVETMGGTNRYLNIELLGTPVSLGLVLLAGILFLATSICAIRFAINKFVLLLLVLQSLVNALFLTDDVFNLFVLLEVVTLVMVLLILYLKEKRSIYDALYYMIIQIIGMSFFLLGLAYLYRAVGQLSMTLIAAAISSGGVTPTQLIIPFALMLTGLALKVGLFPLMSYVPRFYGNPGAPVVVLMLSSAIMATVVIFWIARLSWAFEPVLDTKPILLVLGICTAVIGAAKALVQRDARMLLAFSTVSQAGLMLMALGTGSGYGERGFITHLFAHALAKALLFFCVGAFTEAYGTCNLAVFRERIWHHPILAAALMLAGLSMVGFPLTFGGISKYWIMSSVGGNLALYWLAWLANLMTALVIVRLLVPSHISATHLFRNSVGNSVVSRRRWRGSSTDGIAITRHSARSRRIQELSHSEAVVSRRRSRGSSTDGILHKPIPRYVLAVLASLAFLVALGGLFGTELIRNLLGGSYTIDPSALALKALQILLLVGLAWTLTQLQRRYFDTNLEQLTSTSQLWHRRLHTTLGNSLALPDACLLIAGFFAGIVLISLLSGVI